jgi:hypothetical protein
LCQRWKAGGKGRGKREEGRGKREEGRGKREEGRGKREEGRGKEVGKQTKYFGILFAENIFQTFESIVPPIRHVYQKNSGV